MNLDEFSWQKVPTLWPWEPMHFVDFIFGSFELEDVGLVSKAITIFGKYLTRLCMVLLGCLHQSNLTGEIIEKEVIMIY